MMAGFEHWAVITRLHDGSGKFVLVDDLNYKTMSGSVYQVKAGFHTDLASVPRFLWPWFPPADLYLSAAVLHDFFCESDWISRKDGDRIFYEAMRLSNVPDWKASVVYWGVRLYAILMRIK